MQKKITKITVVLLSAIMLVSLIPTMIFASEAEAIGGVQETESVITQEEVLAAGPEDENELLPEVELSLPEEETDVSASVEVSEIPVVNLEFGQTVTGTFTGKNDYIYLNFVMPEAGRVYFNTSVTGAKYLWHEEFLNQDYSAGTLGNVCYDLKAGNYTLEVSPSGVDPNAEEIAYSVTAYFESAKVSADWKNFELGKTYYGQMAENGMYQRAEFTLTKDTAIRIDVEQWEPEDSHGCDHNTGEFLYVLESKQGYHYENLIWEYGKSLHKTIVLPKGTYYFSVDAQDDMDDYASCTGNFSLQISKVQMPKPVKLQLSLSAITFPRKSGDTEPLIATVTYKDGTELVSNTAVKWTSTDPKVAKVDKYGNLDIGRYGKAVLTATVSGNSKLKATCTIKVNFMDVQDPSKYYYKPAYWAAKKGIATGQSDSNYMYPGNKRLMRNYFVIYLWRMAGSPKVDLKYADILGGYTVKSRRAVAWVTKEGIVKGYKNNPITFHRMLTRKEAMIMLWRYAGKPKVSGKMPFKDVTYKKTSDSYQAILWATQKGITSGKTKTTFAPDETCTRGQALTFLYRYAKKIK